MDRFYYNEIKNIRTELDHKWQSTGSLDGTVQDVQGINTVLQAYDIVMALADEMRRTGKCILDGMRLRVKEQTGFQTILDYAAVAESYSDLLEYALSVYVKTDADPYRRLALLIFIKGMAMNIRGHNPLITHGMIKASVPERISRYIDFDDRFHKGEKYLQIGEDSEAKKRYSDRLTLLFRESYDRNEQVVSSDLSLDNQTSYLIMDLPEKYLRYIIARYRGDLIAMMYLLKGCAIQRLIKTLDSDYEKTVAVCISEKGQLRRSYVEKNCCDFLDLYQNVAGSSAIPIYDADRDQARWAVEKYKEEKRRREAEGVKDKYITGGFERLFYRNE